MAAGLADDLIDGLAGELVDESTGDDWVDDLIGDLVDEPEMALKLPQSLMNQGGYMMERMVSLHMTELELELELKQRLELMLKPSPILAAD